jgi:hypothetical protein
MLSETKMYQAFKIPEEVQILGECVTMLHYMYNASLFHTVITVHF